MDTLHTSFAAGLTGTTSYGRAHHTTRGWLVIPTIERPRPRPRPLPNPDDEPAPVPQDD